MKITKTEKFILHYNPSDEWMYNFLNYGTYDNYEGELQLTDTQGRATQSDCHIVVYPIVENDCGCHGGDEVVGYIIRVHCTAGGGTSSPGGSTPTGPNPGGFPPFDGDPGNGGGNSAFAAFLTLLSNVSQDAHDWFISPENSGVLTQIYNYLESNYHSDASIDFALWAVEYIMNNPGVKFNALLYVVNELDNNPYFFLDIPCNQIPHWQSLAQFILPENVLNKIILLQAQNSDLVPNWDIQFIEGAEGAVVNMDFFPVTITQFPTNPMTGQPYSPQQFLNFFRKNLNLFTTGTNVSFYPSTVTGYNETHIWNSNNPVSAIISINIPLDDGSVICSDYDFSSWTFTTLTTPWTLIQDDYDGFHPVSGNRKFGYYQDVDGNYVFYVRGVDRIHKDIIEDIGNIVFDGNPFENADNLWDTIQTKLRDYVNSNGGSAVINTDIFYRTDWNEIKDVLLGNKPLSDLGCN